jgi:DNA mismatch repair protein MutL
MPRVHRLPPDVANQIAAGEVVERPASVIKELIENSIDAEARRITVTIELGGKKLIRVEDDGVGMDPDDARLAIERHATSKIARAEDLEKIATLGFRGEALPSIASVSHFTLRTRPRDAQSGTEIRINGGVLSSTAEAGMPVGTSIEVADVFYNLPARRKFLKTDGAEAAQVSRIVTQLALCYPEIGFTLAGSGRRVLQCPPVSSLRDRLYQLYGDRADLVEVRRDGDVKVVGYIAALAGSAGTEGPTRGPQNVFINRRIVKDRTIAHAILDAYSVASIKERSPEVHLFIEMPREAVDVNVHPTKAEVRFRDQSYIHQVVRRAVADTLGRGPAPELTLESPRGAQPIPTTLPLPASYDAVYPSRWSASASAFGETGSSGPQALEPSNRRTVEPSNSGTVEPSNSGTVEPSNPGTSEPSTRTSEPSNPRTLSPGFRPLIPLGQFRDTFIIAIDDEGIAIIDQHVAHERVLFERISEHLTRGRLASQRLLDPMLVQMAASERESLKAHVADLDRLGFEVEEFGGDTLRVSAFPALLDRETCEATLRALANDLEGLDRGAGAEAALKQIAATMACHAAVKANYPLTHQKMMHILDELRRTAYSTICPHGRPVMLRLTRREVEKNFQRI